MVGLFICFLKLLCLVCVVVCVVLIHSIRFLNSICHVVNTFFFRHPILPPTDSIDSLVQISDSVICAGGMDGKLRYAVKHNYVTHNNNTDLKSIYTLVFNTHTLYIPLYTLLVNWFIDTLHIIHVILYS